MSSITVKTTNKISIWPISELPLCWERKTLSRKCSRFLKRFALLVKGSGHSDGVQSQAGGPVSAPPWPQPCTAHGGGLP